MEAETELKEQQATLGEFLTKITPAIISQTVRGFMREEGWHPLMVELVADSWESLKQNQTSVRLFQAIRGKFGATEFVDKVERLASDAALHLLTQQMNRLTAIINAWSAQITPAELTAGAMDQLPCLLRMPSRSSSARSSSASGLPVTSSLSP